MLKPRDAPDVVRSTYVVTGDRGDTAAIDPRRGAGGQDYSIDSLFGVPAKMSIPERYVPEQVLYLNAISWFL